jgi:putative copper resistance protein D
MIDLGLVVARLLHYAAVATLAGVSFFPLYAYVDAEPIVLFRWRLGVLFVAAIAALLSGVLWFVFSVANMSGTLADVADREVLRTVLNETTFGRVWTARLVLSIITAGLFWNRVVSKCDPPRRDLITPVLAAVLLISLAGVGHSQIEEGVEGIIHIVSDAAHLLAAGAWLGGLVPLGYILLLHGRERERPAQRSDLNEILLRFSGIGYVAVATLIGSGLINGWFLIGNVFGLFATQYGQLLVVKLVLFAGMLALAVLNRFWIVPSLTKAATDDPNGSTAWMARLHNHVLGEQFLGFMVLLVVSVLGTMRPAIDQ